MVEDRLPEDLILMDCCECGRPMVRACDEKEGKAHGLPVFGGSLAWGRWAKVGHARPFCRACFGPARSFQGVWGRDDPGRRGDEASAFQENAVRALEGE